MNTIGPYKLDNIYCGECSAMMTELPDDCIDLTVTSPPYDNLREYRGYVFDFEPIARQLYRVTKPGGIVVWIVGDATVNGSETGTSFRQALGFMEVGFKLHDTMIYRKPHIAFPDSNRYYQCFEYMFVLSKEYVKTFNLIKDRKNIGEGRKVTGLDRNQNGSFKERSGLGQNYPSHSVRFNDWELSNSQRDITDSHPAIFPEALARDHIISWSNPGDIILDPFCGSGTTCKAAKQFGRHYLGFEISQEYVDLANKRLFQTNPPLFTL